MTTQQLTAVPAGARDDDDHASGRAATLISVIGLIIAIRAIILVVGLLALHYAPADGQPRFNLEHPWIAWDAKHYYAIARYGYTEDRGIAFPGASTFSDIAYFPLVPLVARTLSGVMRIDVAMVVFSNVCSIVGFAFLYDWARRLAGQRAAILCVLLVATFPGAVAFAAGMTEGPFLMMVAMALWLLQRDRLWLAAIVVGVATALRPTGLPLAVVAILYSWSALRDLPMPRRLATWIAISVVSVGGLIMYEGYLWHRYHSPTIYSQAQQNWTHLDEQRLQIESKQGVQRYSWEFFRDRLVRPQTWNRGLAALLLIVTIVGLLKPIGIPRILFLLPLLIFIMTALPGKGLRISSIPRYESAAIPLFMLPAIWLAARNRYALAGAVVLLMFCVQVYYAMLFPREIWVG